ncbi:MAG: alpha/beta fold hydrolase [Thermoleophilaceae bacterium]
MSRSTVEAAGAALAVEEQGEGPAVVLVHGPGLDRASWTETVAALGDDVRAVSYDRRAYGESATYGPFRATSTPEQAEDAARVIEARGAAPAVLCAHDVGALVALDLLVRHSGLVRAAVLVEPALLSLVAAGREATAALRELLAAGAREGGPAGAVEAYLEDLGGGPDVLERLGPERAERARASALPFAADLTSAPAWEYVPRKLRAIAAPVVVVSGERSPAVRRATARALVELLPTARMVEADAGHFVHLEDPAAVAGAVRGLL